MRGIKEQIARVLFIVIFLSCMAENNVLAMAAEADITSLFESIVEETEHKDENESSGAVYFEKAVDDTMKGSNSQKEYAENILVSHNYYCDLTDEERVTVRQELGLREDTMSELCSEGYTIDESRTKALIMQKLGISVRGMLSMTELEIF